jgi:aminoglycoside 3-N-acetyltransferase
MWTKQRILDDLEELRVSAGDTLLVHASMRAVGKVEGGADTVVEALLETVGAEGTVMAPFFNGTNYLKAPVDGSDAVAFQTVEYQPEAVNVAEVGILAERVGRHASAHRSEHPTLSFAAIGHNAVFLTESTPFHYPFGTNSPLARLHQLNGKVLLLGVGHTANSSIHLAEVWANVPYSHRKARVRTGDETWKEMEGSPECSAGFARIEPVLRQARITRSGYVGNAPSQSMRVQFVVSMAREMLVSQPDSLLCDDINCAACTLARKLTRAQDTPGTFDR